MTSKFLGSVVTAALFFLASFGASFGALAAKPAPHSVVVKKNSKAKKGFFGIVIASETLVYEKPDLDSKVIATVRQGVRLPISKGTRGEFAKFHRTRVAGRIGWIVTIDVRPEAVAKKVLAEAKAADGKPGPFKEAADEAAASSSERPGGKEREPFAFTQSVSFLIGQTSFKESVRGNDVAANLLTYGLKVMGPDVLLTGPIMDFNFVFHYGAPAYYENFSQLKPSGFLTWLDTNLLLPIFFREDSLVALGVGPALVVSNIQTTENGEQVSDWNFNLGASLEMSAGHRFDDFTVRFEGKYYFEEKTYHQFQLALGTVF